MMIRNTDKRYGLLSVSFHWLTALLIAILFPLGLIMVDLDYYDAGYQTYPPLHKSLGVLLALLVLLRLIWNMGSHPPTPISASKVAGKLIKMVHHLLYFLIGLVVMSGYLVSTADGRDIDVFGWFHIPALISPIKHQADIAGQIHFYAAWSLVGLIGLHIVGAVKHHVLDKDRTLWRMLGR